MRKATYNRKTRIEYKCFQHDVYEYGYGDNKYIVKKWKVKGDKGYSYSLRIRKQPFEMVIDSIYITIPDEWKDEVKVTETFNIF